MGEFKSSPFSYQYFLVVINKIILLAFLIPFVAFAQNGTLEGKITDHSTNEPIIGAYVYISDEYRSKAGMDGSYSINNIPYGDYLVKISMFSFDTIVTTITINEPVVVMDFSMGDTQEMEEVEVIGQLAVDRKTPVAVSRISAKQITEELGSQELPMILNSTPGVHATQQGGGDGDARISIRGFNRSEEHTSELQSRPHLVC